MKLFVLVFGLAVGFGGGIWYGVQHPEWAKDFAQKEEKWVNQGKEDAYAKVRDMLNTKLAETGGPGPATPGGTSGFLPGGGGGKSDAAALKDVKNIVDAKLSEVAAKAK